LDDSAQRFPRADFSDNRIGLPPAMHTNFPKTVLQPYTQSEGVFTCPTMRALPDRAALYPTDYNYLCVHGWSLLPFFSGFFGRDKSSYAHEQYTELKTVWMQL
jgi:hypothetical protein